MKPRKTEKAQIHTFLTLA